MKTVFPAIVLQTVLYSGLQGQALGTVGPPDTDHAEGDREVPAPPHSSGVVPLTQPEVPEEKDDEPRE